MTEVINTEVLVVGSGAGGATTAAVLAAAGRRVVVVEEGPWVEPDSVEPFSLDEMVAKYRHHGSSAALGSPPIAYAEGRCVGGSTEINSGLWHRLPDELADEWRVRYDIDEFTPDTLARYAERVETWQSVATLPGAPPVSSALLERGATKLGWRSVEFPRVFRFGDEGRAVKQTMARTLIPRAVDDGAEVLAGTRVDRLVRAGRRVVGAVCTRDGAPLEIRAQDVIVCAGAVHTPALLQRSGFRRGIGNGLKLHPTIKIAARFPHPVDHGDVPMHRVTEFAPNLTIGGSASRKGHVALSVADAGIDPREALDEWEHVSVYYAAIRSDAGGRVLAVPGLRSPVVTYRLTDGDLSRLARGLVHLGELLLAAGATVLYPSVIGGRIAHRLGDLGSWWSEVDRRRANLMSVHLTSSVRMGQDRHLAAADSFGRVHGVDNLRVNDASLLPDAPGVNPQAAIMTIALRNSEHFLADVVTPAETVVVTGASGWLGQNLVRALGDRTRVRCLVPSARDEALLQVVGPNIETVAGDVRDPVTADRLFEGVGAGATVFHAAGVIHPHRLVRELFDVNVGGTQLLVDRARRSGAARFLHVSSNSPFGANPTPAHRFDESSPENPYLAYGRSKQEAESIVRRAGARGDLATVIVRPPWFYGPFQPERQSQWFAAVRRGRFPLVGDGSQQRSMVYAGNLVHGLLRAEASDAAPGRAWWIADPEPYELRHVLDTVRAALEAEGLALTGSVRRLPRAASNVAARADAFVQSRGRYVQALHVLGELKDTIACDVGPARRELGYAPPTTLLDGMRASVRWCLERGIPL